MAIETLQPSSPEAVFDFLERRGTPRGRKHWAWKYQLEQGADGRAFYHSANDAVGGFIGLLPTTLHAGDNTTARAAWFVDWATAPGEGSVGVGVGLLRRAQAATDILLTLEGSEDTRKILPKLRWASTETPATWVLRLSPRAIAERGPLRNRFLRWPALLAGSLAHIFYRVSKPPELGFSLEEVDRFAESYDAVWARRRAEFAPLMDRSSAQLNFMCAEFPDGGYRRFIVRDGAHVSGHLILRLDEYKGLRRGRIIDALWDRKRSRMAEWLVRAASRLLQEGGADYIECTASASDLEDALRACRFRRRRAVPVWYHRLPDDVPKPDAWFITYFDCDRAYR